MNKSTIIKFILFLLVICLFVHLNLFAQSRSQNYKIFTDVLDEFGGKAGSENYLLRIGTGGQPSVVGLSKDSSFFARQGYVNTAAFVHGDDNADGKTTVSDVVYEINYLFKGGPAPLPPEVGDVNGDLKKTVADVVYLINYLFKYGPPAINL